LFVLALSTGGIVNAEMIHQEKGKERAMSNTTLLILIVVLFLLFGGGGGYYWSRSRL
jgi:hypothetical protein